MNIYNPKEIEAKWRKYWEENNIYRVEDNTNKPKCYVLDMFPYPSGAGLHVGHPKGYIATDIYSRFKKMNGFNVLHPMGWDAFGLPAENYAIKNKVHPSVAVEKNIEVFKLQLEKIGFNFDWTREINTTDPEYYRWTQWCIARMFEAGLMEEVFEPIIWCPTCKTGLALEDLEDGKCERCGSVVEKKKLRQWLIKITKYADRLLEGLDRLDWEDSIKDMQRHWIGRSEGAEIRFGLQTTDNRQQSNTVVRRPSSVDYLEVFTTRPDTLFGATYLVVAPEHELVEQLKSEIQNWNEIESYIEKTKSKSDVDRQATKEKTGVELKGISVIHPVTGESLPIWIADYVMMGYGTGAIMAVPAHDERDHEFAKKFDLPIKMVIDKNKYLIFDFDGVIGNTSEAGLKAKMLTGQYADIDEARKSTIAYASKKPNHTRDHILTAEELKKEYEWVKSFGEQMNKQKIELFDDFISEILKIKNAKIGIVSSGSELYVKPAIERTQIDPSHILTFEDHHSKEEKIERICKDWNVSVDDVYYFTDTKADVYELEKLLPQGHIIGCSWGVSGKKELESVLPREFVLETHVDIHRLFTTLHVGDGVLINSQEFDGLVNGEAKEKMIQWLEENKKGVRKVQYKLRDWVFARQRYWGEPFPFIHKENGEIEVVSDKELPVTLPEVEHYEPTGTGESPLATIESWVDVPGGKRETNTMPQWAGSSWYYLRYIDPKNSKKLVDPKKEKYWMGENGVDLYVGGTEHATRHLIYARFWHKFLFDQGVVSTDEPFHKLVNVGLIMAEDGRKMSKRWNNVINPDDVIAKYGADSFRLYEMFIGPFTQSAAWNTNGVEGVYKFLQRYVRLYEKEVVLEVIESQEKLINKTIKKVTNDIGAFQFNTSVSEMMITVNELTKEERIQKSVLERFNRILAPFAVHLTEELYHTVFQGEGSIHQAEWPDYDESKLVEDTISLAVQINGKMRGTVEIAPDATEKEALKLAQSHEQIAKWFEGKEPKKIIYVSGKILNIVV